MLNQSFISEKPKNLVNTQEAERLKSVIDNKEPKEILDKLLGHYLDDLEKIKIGNKSALVYCLEKKPNIMRNIYKFSLNTFASNLIMKKLLPLHYAIDNATKEKFLRGDRCLDPIYICLQLGAEVNTVDEEGDTALHFYVKRIIQLQKEFDESPTIKELKENDPEINSQYRPALHPKILLLLLENGANVALSNNEMKTVLDYISPPIIRYINLYVSNKKYQTVFFGKSVEWGSNSAATISVANDLLFIDKFPKHQFISSIPAVPLKPKLINQVAAQQWVATFNDNTMKQEAQRLVNSIRYINFKEFLTGLQKTVASFNDYLMQQHETERQYILAIDGRSNNSSPWVSSLAMCYLKFTPNKIIDLNEMKKINSDLDVNHILFIDDASYSGNQLVDRSQFSLNLRVINNSYFAAQFHIAIPYMTKTTIDRLTPYGFIIHQHETIEEIKSTITAGRTLTYFQHKLAQPGISTANFLTGILPEIKPPYKLDPLIQEIQGKSEMIILKQQHNDKFILDCFDKAAKNEDFPPYERTYTYKDAVTEVKKYLMLRNKAPDSQASFFKPSTSSIPEMLNIMLHEEKKVLHNKGSGLENADNPMQKP